MKKRNKMKYQMNLCDNPFRMIKSGQKTIEMRLNKEDRKAIKIGDTIEFTNNISKEKLECIVLNKYEYRDFDELYKNHDKKAIGYLENEIPNPKDMLIYYCQEDIDKYGVVGIEIKVKQ